MNQSTLRAALIGLLAAGLAAGGALAFESKSEDSPLAAFEFFAPELYISSAQAPLAELITELPNRGAWESLQATAEALGEAPFAAYIDPRSGAATNLLGAFPLIPGRGVGNRVSLESLGARLGRSVRQVDREVVAEAVLAFIRQHREVLGIDLTQLGKPKAEPISADLWQVSIPQTYRGIPVRHGRLGASISHGNLVTIGTETWGNVAGLAPVARLSAAQALETGFGHIGGRLALDRLVAEPRLEIMPVAPQHLQSGTTYVGALGAGYRHRLTWVFSFNRPPDMAMFEVMVDAHTGEMLAFQDTNQYAAAEMKGGVYPITSTEICPNADTCGTMQTGWPMPFANTGLAAPNNFTNSAGIFDYTSGTVTTTLSGRYIRIADSCGAVSNSSTTGNLNLGGVNGQHDCTTGGGSAGNTPAARTAFYELNRIAELGRGWLPSNTWLQAQLTSNVNVTQTCNAGWGGGQVTFFRSGGGCRNTGEIAGVFDHEWGHGLDDNDANGILSNTSEAYADIAAIYRLEASCVGHGFFQTADKGCGTTADGTGFNANEAKQGPAHCDLDCSGVRDADWDRHADHAPDTALGFVCTSCTASTGPCGKQVHCAAAPPRQAAWDLVNRDLAGAPFNLDSQSAFVLGNRLFYLGSGNIGTWYACTCGSSSSGCGSTNGYMQWLTADDDNGNLSDGTPHMTAIFNAFNRHGIACSTPTAVNSGCASGPSTAPTLTATPGDRQVALSWTSVAGASRYWVFRSDGHAGCNFGKTRIADLTTTSFTDTQVGNGRQYSYNVVAQGSSTACFSRVSTCQSVTPAASTTPDFTVGASPGSLTVNQGANGTSSVTVTSVNGFASAVTLSCTGAPAGVTCGFSTNPVTPPANGSAASTLTVSVAGSTTPGTYAMTVQGVSGATTKTAPLSLTVAGPGPVTVFFDDFETDKGWLRNAGGTDTATLGLWERGDPETTTSSGTKQLGTTVSGVNDLVTARLAGASAGANDVDGGVTTILSPAIALPSTGTLTLGFSYYLAHGTNASTADFLRIYVVGATTTLAFEELAAADNDDAVWASGSANISAFAGQTVRIRIEAADTATASLVEAAVDDLRITQQ